MSKYFFQEHPLVKHLLYMLGISIAILVLVFFFIRLFARQGAEYELPDFRGVTIEELEKDNPLGLRFVVIDSLYEPDSEGGVILQQDPKPGTMIKTHRKIYVSVAAYDPSGVVMPEVGNMSVRSAVSALESVGLHCGRLEFVDSPYKNVILECSSKGKLVYAGEKLHQGATIDLTVGLGDGDASTIIPFVIGQKPAKVHRSLLSASLNVGAEHYDGVKDRRNSVCYRLEPDYTGVSHYPLGTYVEVWYCDASEADAERIISSFKVDSTKIVETEELEEDDSQISWGDDWDW